MFAMHGTFGHAAHQPTELSRQGIARGCCGRHPPAADGRGGRSIEARPGRHGRDAGGDTVEPVPEQEHQRRHGPIAGGAESQIPAQRDEDEAEALGQARRGVGGSG